MGFLCWDFVDSGSDPLEESLTGMAPKGKTLVVVDTWTFVFLWVLWQSLYFISGYGASECLRGGIILYCMHYLSILSYF